MSSAGCTQHKANSQTRNLRTPFSPGPRRDPLGSDTDEFGNRSQELPPRCRSGPAATSLPWAAVPFLPGVTKGAVSTLSSNGRTAVRHRAGVPSPTQARQCEDLLCSPATTDLARQSLGVVLLPSHGRESLKLEQMRSRPRSNSVWVHREPLPLETPLTRSSLRY